MQFCLLACSTLGQETLPCGWNVDVPWVLLSVKISLSAALALPVCRSCIFFNYSFWGIQTDKWRLEITSNDDVIELYSVFFYYSCVQVERNSVLYTILTQGVCASDFPSWVRSLGFLLMTPKSWAVRKSPLLLSPPFGAGCGALLTMPWLLAAIWKRPYGACPSVLTDLSWHLGWRMAPS